MTLIIGIGPVLYTLNNPDPQIQSLLFCKLRGYIFQICLMLSRWFVAFACIDRFASTSDKITLRNFAKPRITYRTIIIIIIFWSIICSHRLIFYEIKGSFCGIINNMAAALYHSVYVIIGGGIFPAMIMIICAYFIRRNLAHKHQRRAQLSLGDYQRNRLDQQVLKILFVQIICYIIFTSPQLCSLVFSTISITISNRSSDQSAIESFLNFLAELMLYLFPVTSFYLYTLTSRRFRKELIDFFRLLLVSCGGNRIVPIAAASIPRHRIEHNETTINASVKPTNK
ncbi:unnamed protein product [Rotaria sordida]|uniref:G-protein coupled receptors family 1 profile domain-containing protein n=2 Tax=Rotaria sordida TaxID=392033 RepID=A0A819XE32_9BILA|nr:unnamed protein product [Rotaria sordida]